MIVRVGFSLSLIQKCEYSQIFAIQTHKRLKRLDNWCGGKEFHGAIAFDESQKLKNVQSGSMVYGNARILDDDDKDGRLYFDTNDIHIGDHDDVKSILKFDGIVQLNYLLNK